MSEYLPPPHGTFVIPADNPLIGVQLGAARMHDDLVLQVAFELEEAMPWAHRRPRVCAR